MPWPKPGDLAKHAGALAAIVAEESLVPAPKVVAAFDRGVFPTLRRNSKNPLFSTLKVRGEDVAMYDDNVTPEWALMWSHGIFGTRPQGWTVAHVWPTTKDHLSYTHLANLALVPEGLGSTTDKTGPLTGYLRYHAWSTYGWKPKGEEEPAAPPDYAKLRAAWRYLERGAGDPRAVVAERFLSLDNQRTRVLGPIMEKLGHLG